MELTGSFFPMCLLHSNKPSFLQHISSGFLCNLLFLSTPTFPAFTVSQPLFHSCFDGTPNHPHPL